MNRRGRTPLVLLKRWFSLRGSSFLSQLVLTFSAGIILLAVITSYTISRLSTQSIEWKITEDGRQLTDSFAAQSTLALLYKSPENAQDAVKATLGFPDVLGIAIYDADHQPILTKGEPLAEQGSDVWPDTLTLSAETRDAWQFVAPVYYGKPEDLAADAPFDTQSPAPELLGHVRVMIGKASLHELAGSIRRVSLIVSLTLAVILLLTLLAVTHRVTYPLKNLAKIMRRAQQGETDVRAELHGPRDVVAMESAFNAMLGELEDRAQQLHSARDNALESARVKGEFAANVSHELRTPLNGVLGMLELLQNQGLTAKQDEYVGVARRSGNALLALIDDILDFSRIETGKLRTRAEDFYLREVLDDVIEVLKGQTQRKGLDLGYIIEDAVPHALCGDPARLRQLLINLGGNAVKFTAAGEIGIAVKVREHTASGLLLEFEVRDTGIGIEAAAQSHIFEAFSQADSSTTRRFGGAGLGLAICRKLVEVMGGQIGVVSEPGAGSRFWFELLLQQAELPERPHSVHAAASELKVLVVDDSEVYRTNLEQCFKEWGAAYRSTEDGPRALEVLRAANDEDVPFDIAIIDERMPSMDGSELIRLINREFGNTRLKIIMMSHQRQLGRHEAYMAGLAASIVKPISQSALYNVIAEIAGQIGRGQPELPPPAAVSAPRTGASILVVEDNRANQQVARGMLEQLGYRVTLVYDGRDALNALAGDTYDLVLMDCNMPEMDGYEATRRIRNLPREYARIPIIAMTANVQTGDSEACLTAGMNDYLAKPLQLASLQQMLERWLKQLSADMTQAAPPGVNEEALSGYLDQPMPAERGDSLNSEVFKELRSSIGGAFTRMIEVFLEDTPEHLKSLEHAVEHDDAQALIELAHSIKGSARNFGADRLATLGRQLEDLGRAGTTQGAERLLHELTEENARVMQALRCEVRSAPPALPTAVQQEDSPARVLIVDDDRGMRLALANVLEGDGYQLEEVPNGSQALALCERRMPDLILMDAMMPELDGFTACARIRALPAGKVAPILIITALDDEDSIERAFTAGATDYIPKPVHYGVMRQRIARLVVAGRTEQQVRRLAYNDPLTGLPNRTTFMERLGELMAKVRGEDRMLAILFLDLDRFKLVNDTLGHDVGDLLLKAVSERILGCVRAGDLVARLGGDEFTVILNAVNSPRVVAQIAEKICATLNEPFTFVGREMYVSTSIGISLYPDDGGDISTLMKHADTAMFRAKERGGHYHFYESGMEAAVTLQVEIENDLRRALLRDELEVHYQPKCNLVTGQIAGLEALVRWHHPEKGLISPAEFIPLAERTGLIQDVGLWVLITACVQMQSWQEQGYAPVPVAVNLSGRQLERTSLAEQVGRVLEKTSLHAGMLELEITESTLMNNPEDVILILQQLTGMGVSLAVDDFGTGYSSLNYLRRFPIDTLKIDAAFVRDIASDHSDVALISGIIALAQNLRLKVVAEGVETAAQATYLGDRGCDEIQGYYLSRPLPAPEIEQRFLTKIGQARAPICGPFQFHCLGEGWRD